MLASSNISKTPQDFRPERVELLELAVASAARRSRAACVVSRSRLDESDPFYSTGRCHRALLALVVRQAYRVQKDAEGTGCVVGLWRVFGHVRSFSLQCELAWTAQPCEDWLT